MVSEPLFSIPKIPKIDVQVPAIPAPAVVLPDVSGIMEDAFATAFGEKNKDEACREEWTIPLEDLDDARMIDITHDHGNIVVAGSDSEPFQIVALKRIYGDSEERAKEVADQYTVETEYDRASATLKLRSVRPRRTPKGIDGAAVDYFVTAPKEISLKVDADHGNFEARSLRGDVEIHHDHGHVNLKNIEGRLYSETDHGNLTVDELVGEKIEIEHDHGNVEVDNFAGLITCNVDHGNVILDDVCGPVQLNFEHGNARIVAVQRLSGEWEIEGGHGDCYFVLPPNANVNMALETHHGHINSRYAVEIHEERNYKTGDLERNGGGTPIRITVQDGDIQVD